MIIFKLLKSYKEIEALEDTNDEGINLMLEGIRFATPLPLRTPPPEVKEK